MKQYQSVANGQEKVFVKLGGLHTSIGPQLGAYDIGDLCRQIAQRQGKKSTSFACTSRFYQEDGKTHDYWNQSQKKGSVFDFSMLGEMERYALIDMRSIREMVANGSISLPTDANYHEIRNIIDNYDHLIVLPLDEEQTPNR